MTEMTEDEKQRARECAQRRLNEAIAIGQEPSFIACQRLRPFDPREPATRDVVITDDIYFTVDNGNLIDPVVWP